MRLISVINLPKQTQPQWQKNKRKIAVKLFTEKLLLSFFPLLESCLFSID